MKTIQHKFVESIPDVLEEGVLYISLQYCTAIHKCVCGCGNEVVTPLAPTDWKMTFDGVSITLHPSIGNWNFECRSHYWIVRNEIQHAIKWDTKHIECGGKNDEVQKRKFFSRKKKRKRWFSRLLKSIF
jgi:hypothetical protein